MSVKIMAQVFDRYHSGGGERLLALALADCASDDGTRIFPSVPLLAKMSAQSERSVQRQTTAMLASGWLVLVRKSTGRRGDTTEYRVSPEWLAGGAPVPPQQAADRATRRKLTGDKMAPVQAVDKPSKHASTGDTAVSPVRVTPEVSTGDTAVSPNPSLPIKEIPPHAPPSGGSRGFPQTAERPEPRTHVDPQPPARSGADAGFDELLRRYPRKVDQLAARREWGRIAPSAALQREMLEAVGRWNASEEWRREQGRFVPKLARWLREHRWRDVPGNSAPVLVPAATATAPPIVLTAEQLAQNRRNADAAIGALRSKWRASQRASAAAS